MKKVLFLFTLLAAFKTYAQDELLDALDKQTPPETDYTYATFKSSRVINGHSVETVNAKHLDFRISHRFGALNSGAVNLFGLDQATMRMGFEYGITDRLMVGLGRSTYEKNFDFFGKYKILRQSTGSKNMPISMVLFTSAVATGQRWYRTDIEETFARRLSYATQLLIARKFNDSFSLQITPTYIHKNLVETNEDKNDLLALGIGGRLKLTKRISLNSEYFIAEKNNNHSTIYNSFSVGFDIETGGHVFQLHVTNSTSMNEKGFITENAGSWGKGDILYGFNVSRTFSFRK